MNIGITCYPTYGGSGVVATELGIELAKRGHNVHFIAYEIPFRLNRFYPNVYFHEVEVLEYPLFKYPPYSLSLSAKMAEVVEEEKLDILHVHYAMPHAASAYLAREIVGRERVKVITTLHGTDITLVGNHASFYKITKFSIENSDGITCVSQYLRERTIDIFRIEKELKVIYNFVDTEQYRRNENTWNEVICSETNFDKAPLKRSTLRRTALDVATLGGETSGSVVKGEEIEKEIKSKNGLGFINKGEKVVIHISNFRPVKRIESVVKIFSRISREVNSKLIMVGDGPEVSTGRNMVEKLGLKDKVCFLGRQDNVIPLLASSDLFLLPSTSESFGLSALEAMSCEVPVIGTSNGGLKEVVEHGKSGFLFDPEDIGSMSEAAIKILSDDKLRARMGLEARKRAKLFDSSIIVPQYIEYYEEILQSSSNRL